VNGDFCGSGSDGEFTSRASDDSAAKGVWRERKEIKEVISKWQRKAEAVE
jgi:hypothetical protein